ncbi:hypothetical protein HNQ80_000083 [Anaerosolibacter carboniphilus]|uniref:DUF4829 domain-containing protein n=1 Tax=Anaerosolibacter carboniphilus TaxID=1417629 RepID=A0A841KJH1_9FIRM|nr:hypothetical protein [Anaerosolibacter carboniphilus]MBB6214014.1 hypothetical protein [Anaerosolibacter carboniphilus]
MKRFYILVAMIMLLIYLGMTMNIQSLYPDQDQLANMYLRAKEDEAYFMEIKKEIWNILEVQTSNTIKKNLNGYMKNIAKVYRDDKTRDYALLKEALQNEWREYSYQQLNYKVDIYYPTPDGIWVRALKVYSLEKDNAIIGHGKEVEDLLFIREKGRWKIKTSKKISELI